MALYLGCIEVFVFRYAFGSEQKPIAKHLPMYILLCTQPLQDTRLFDFEIICLIAYICNRTLFF